MTYLFVQINFTVELRKNIKTIETTIFVFDFLF